MCFSSKVELQHSMQDGNHVIRCSKMPGLYLVGEDLAMLLRDAQRFIEDVLREKEGVPFHVDVITADLETYLATPDTERDRLNVDAEASEVFEASVTRVTEDHLQAC